MDGVMSKHTEDTMYEIHQEVTQKGLWEKFDVQLKKMHDQDKHKWKTVCEMLEYALKRIKE
jgi:hypothetical protein|tara:strand:- start:1618 stop:1800 length:183 start_codon:yes stop_codon:yes gene_type:complete